MKRYTWLFLAAVGVGHAQPSPIQIRSFNWEERLDQYIHRTYSWQRLSLLAADAGLDRLSGGPGDWGRGPRSYGYRYAASFGSRVARNSIELGFGAALRQDLRFQPSPETGLRARLAHAVRHTFLARLPDGSTEPAYARFGAVAGGAIIASTWQPRPITGGGLAADIGFGMLGHLENNLLAEFGPDLRRVGGRLWRKLRKR